MNNNEYDATINDLKRALAHRSALAGILAISLLLMVLSVFRLIGMERIIVSPPNLSTPFWVQGDVYSNAYLEQMGAWVAWLVLDVAPSSIEWKKNALLGIVSPDVVGQLRIRQDLEAARLKRLNASTYFLPRQLVPDEAKQTVRILGLLHTQINGHNTPPVVKTYEAAFNNKGGRMHLSRFEEVKENEQVSLAAGDRGAALRND